MAFYDINDNMALAEEFVKYLVQYALDNCMDDLQFLNDKYDDGLIERMRSVLGIAFQKVTYTEAVEILEKHIRQFNRLYGRKADQQ
jgi:asparaginyl-tRNA synthetase